jgi:hypothetical protein
MYRISTFGVSPLGPSRRILAAWRCSVFACLTALLSLALFAGPSLQAQSTSGGGIQGTVLDKSGAAVPKAQITVTNVETGVQVTRESSASGTYFVQPLQAGTYNVEVVAKGFQRLLQENVNVDNASMVGLNLRLTVGGDNTTVTITDAPPVLDTTDATLGGTIENELYSQLPLSMNGGTRDPTAFQYLLPGVQEAPGNNTNQGSTAGASGIYSGTGQTNLNQNYVEGVPVSNINAQGSGTQVSNAVSVDAVDQFSVQTSNSSASFSGAGVTNYTIKSGGNQFHGDVFDFVRNTLFDTWGYFAKVPTSTGTATKPAEHQNNYGGTVAGPILKDKLFFFGSYEGFHYTKISNTPQYITIPTIAERAGNFTDVLGTVNPGIADGTQGAQGSRPYFQGLLNGVPTYNVMPSSSISSISNYLQSALPTPTNLSTFSNYLASLPLENKNYDLDGRIDYTISARHKLSIVGLGGLLGYGGEPDYSNYTQLPIPYAAGLYINQKTASGIISYTYIVSQKMINSVKYGFTRNWGQGFPLTQGTKYTATAAGITNLPPGDASNTFPIITFGQMNGPAAPVNWGSSKGESTGPQATNAYTAIDNLQWIIGRHNVTFGAQIQWLETNGGYGSYSVPPTLNFNASTTEITTTNTGYNGDAYASFLLGAVETGSISTQSILDVGARYRPISPYIQDNWQVNSKLSVNLGLRYDYLQPYHEVKDRISFINPTLTNPIVGIPGVVEYAGFPSSSTPAAYAPYLCHCTTPVHPYNKNLQPRVGFAYAATPSTVISAGFGVQLTHSGGVGGGANATGGTGNSGEFQASTSYPATGSSAGLPSFFLNPNYLQGTPSNATYDPPVQGTNPVLNGTAIPCVAAKTCSAFSSIPPWTPAGITVNPLQSTGNYNYTNFFADKQNDYGCTTSDNQNCSPSKVNFADPYYGGRGPQVVLYNFSIQHLINKKAVLSLSYSGSESHFLPGGAGRGYAQNGLSPDYGIPLKNYLGSPASNEIAVVQSILPGYKLPYPLFSGPQATVAQSLLPFPQFGSFTDVWSATGNAAYNSFQILLIQRVWHNLSGLMSYTRAKTIDDTGAHRTQFPLGPQDGNFTHQIAANEVDRGLSQYNQTNAFNVAFNYTLPIGRHQALFATNRIAGLIGGGWEINGIYEYRDGYPLQIQNGSGCEANSNAGQGTCFPDLVPGFNKKTARINGRWGRGPGSNSTNFQSIPYLNEAAFACPDSGPYPNNTYTCGTGGEPNTTYKIGNSPRSAPYGLTGPGWWVINGGIRRTFTVRETASLHLTFQIEGDVTNLTNSTFFNISNNGSPSVNTTQWNTTTFGTVSGQNSSVIPRDWQFAGRFRF